MKGYVCVWRAIVLLNATTLICGILLTLSAAYLLAGFAYLVYFLFEADQGDAFFDAYLIMTIAAIYSGFVAGVGITLGVTPHRCISTGFAILALIGVLMIGMSLARFYSIHDEIKPEYVNISSVFDDEPLSTMEGLSNLHFLQNYFECCGLHGPNFYGEEHGAHFNLRSFSFLRKKKKKKKKKVTTTTTVEPVIPIEFDYNMEKLPFSCCGLYYFNLQCTTKISFTRGCSETAQEYATYDDSLVEKLALIMFGSQIAVVILVLFIVVAYKFTPVMKRERFSSANK